MLWEVFMPSFSTLVSLTFAALLFSCSQEAQQVESAAAPPKDSWALADGSEFPAGRPLARAEDGVELPDGTLIVADQRYGLAKIDTNGNVEPFGNFDAVDYAHNPPEREGGPNGVHFSADKTDILTADVFSGQIYKTSVEKGTTEIIYSHDFGVNTAIEDSTGAVWFTQSTQNITEERLFEAIARPIPDGVLYRLPPVTGESMLVKPEAVLEGLNFANGFYLDESKNRVYLSETLGHRVLAFDLDIAEGTIANQSTLSAIPSPDNMQLNHDGRLWVASPLSNQIFSIDVETGESFVVFDAQTDSGAKAVLEGLRRSELGEGIVDLLVPETIGDMPGLLTGMIIGESPESFYVANLGEALIKVSVKQP
jgi:sugar lactone lactonase YvrE